MKFFDDLFFLRVMAEGQNELDKKEEKDELEELLLLDLLDDDDDL